MKRIDKLLKGIELLRKYDEEDLGYFDCEHDEFFYGDSDYEISEEDLKLLDEWGWHIDTENDLWCKFS